MKSLLDSRLDKVAQISGYRDWEDAIRSTAYLPAKDVAERLPTVLQSQVSASRRSLLGSHPSYSLAKMNRLLDGHERRGWTLDKISEISGVSVKTIRQIVEPQEGRDAVEHFGRETYWRLFLTLDQGVENAVPLERPKVKAPTGVTQADKAREEKAKEKGYDSWEQVIRATGSQSVRDVAKHFGVTESTVRTWRKNFGIKTVNRSAFTASNFKPAWQCKVCGELTTSRAQHESDKHPKESSK